MKTFKVNDSMSPKKNLKQKGISGTAFFLLVSIFVFVSVSLGSFFRVATFLYDQDIALLNKLDTEETLSALPITGTPDDQFFLMALTIIFAIAITFAIMLKLSRMKFNVKDEVGKSKKFSIKNNPALLMFYYQYIFVLRLKILQMNILISSFYHLKLLQLKNS